MRHRNVSTSPLRRSLVPALGAVLLSLSGLAQAWDMSGTRTVYLHPREGEAIPIGQVSFSPEGDRQRFTLKMDHGRFGDFFLSMREFKCIEGGGETTCHVPYPYPMPATVTPGDLRWLEHALLFLWNQPRDYGAKLHKGLYYKMQITPEGIVGLPQAVDMAVIGAPPANLQVPPFGEAERSEMAPGTRWFGKLTIR